MNEPLVKSHIYHFYNRGCNKANIFFNQGNYLYLLRKVKESYQKYGVGILAYCLMPNHYHFLLRQETERPLSDWIGQLFNGYVQAVNRQTGRSGTLFESRAKHVLVDKNEYFVHLARYIHINPVVAGLVAEPDGWPYSNYAEWVELRNGTLVDREFVKSCFETPQDYRDFVLSYIEEKDTIEGLEKYYLDEKPCEGSKPSQG